MEKKNTGRIAVCIVLVLAVFSLYGMRLADWQLINGSSFRETSDSTNTYTVKIEPARGEILDTNGVELAMNITGYKVVFDKLYMDMQQQNETILKLIAIFKQRGEKWIDNLPITLGADGNYSFVAGKEDEVAALKSNDFARLADYATAQQCIDKLADKDHYNCAQYTPEQKRDIISVRYNMQKNGFNYETKYTFADGISSNMVAIVAENAQTMPGVKVNTSPVRKYVHGAVAPNIVGAIGAITQKQYTALKEKGYKLNSKIGQSGIESAMESYLAGKEGSQIVEATTDGGTVNVVQTVNAQPGNTVYSTIDARLQTVTSDILKKAVEGAQKINTKKDTVTGAAVVLNVKDFSVLAAQSYPSYDLTRYMEDENYYNQLISDEKYKPLNDRAINGTFAVGSTMKPCVAAAALQEGTITTGTTVYCDGAYHRFADSGYEPECYNHIAHGRVNVITALQESCNVFFLETGYNLGIKTLNQYQRRFGLGVDTGIEIYANDGVLASPEEREAAGGTWYGGDDAAAAIGQSDNLLTPLQLATYVATIANNGVRLNTHVVSKITDYARQNVVMETQGKEMANVGVSQQNLNIVKQGMRQVVTSGTAESVFGKYDIPVAAKTGTAENNGEDHELFIGYAPYDDPQIAIAVIIEHGKTSTWSLNAAKEIFDAYFKGTGMVNLPAVNPDGSLSSAPSSSSAASGTNTTSSGIGSSTSSSSAVR